MAADCRGCPARHLGTVFVQVTMIPGAQQATMPGDLQTERTIENVMGNLWSLGPAIVMR